MKEGCSLVDISWHVPDGYLVAVVGAVGTGKSSLLSGNVNMVKEFHYVYCKVVINSLSWLVACFQIFKWLVKGKIDASVL